MPQQHATPPRRTNRHSSSVLVGTVLLAIAACGAPSQERAAQTVATAPVPAAEAPPPLRDEPYVEASPLLPNHHRVSLYALYPDYGDTKSPRAVGRAGDFLCRQVYGVPQTGGACAPDGPAVNAYVLHHWRPNGEVEYWLDRPLSVVEISKCGRRQKRIAKPAEDLVQRLAPGLLDAQPSHLLPFVDVRSEACSDPRLVLELPDDVVPVRKNSVLRFHLEERLEGIRLVHGRKQLGEWSVGRVPQAQQCDDGKTAPTHHVLDLEALCFNNWAVVSAGVWRLPKERLCTSTEGAYEGAGPALACVPETIMPGYIWSNLKRFLINLHTGETTQIDIPSPVAERATGPR